MPTVDLTARLARESKASGKDVILFDKSLPGFGLRIHPSGRKVWIVQARIEGRSRRVLIARYGATRPAEARRRARDMLDRIRAGGNPADDIRREKQTPTFREFTVEYLRRSDPHWKPSGRETVRIYLKARILPAFGKMPLDRISTEDVAAWFDAASRDKPGAANRALEAHEARWPEAVAAIRLLALTGFRRSEVLDLRWRDIGMDTLNLGDSKTGPRVHMSRRCPVNATPTLSCSRAMRKGGATIRSGNAGARSVRMRSSATCAYMTFGTR